MVIIGLDLAVRTVGLAIKVKENNVYNLTYFSYRSKEKDYLKLLVELADWVFGHIGKYLEFEHLLIIEDLYVGLDPTSALDAAKVQGAVIDRYYKKTQKFPTIIGAMAARKLVGIDARASKAEIQLTVVERLLLGEVPPEVKSEIVQSRNHYELIKRQVNESRKSASKVLKDKLKKDQTEAKRNMGNAMNRMSTQIRLKTGIDEHQADALVLVMGAKDE